MKKIIIFLICVFLIVISLIPQIGSDDNVRGTTLYVGGTGGGNYSTIQSAIDASSSGDWVFVYNGIYYENVFVNKTIDLIGEDRNNTIIDGGKNLFNDTVKITADNVTIQQFYLRNPGEFYSSNIHVESNNNVILNNLFTRDHVITWELDYGIYLMDCSGNNIQQNVIWNMSEAIFLDSSDDNIIDDNFINENGAGIGGNGNNNSITDNSISYCSNGVTFCGMNTSDLKDNIISYHSFNGLVMYGANKNNTISNNTVSYNGEYGIKILNNSNISENCFFHNNLINNSVNALDSNANSWDDGYPSGGNYWDDYNGLDNDYDGIGDTSYNISAGLNQDLYPLMFPYGNEPIAYWKFDEGSGSTAHDSSGNGNHGTLQGANWVNGKMNTAIEIIDTDIVDQIPSSFDDSINEYFTFITWVNWYGQDMNYSYRNSYLFDSRDDIWNGGGFILNINQSGIVNFEMRQVYDNQRIRSNTQIPKDIWTQIAIVYDDVNDTLRLYLNGVLDNTTIAVDPYINTNYQPAIGNNHWAPGDGQWAPFNGIIDEIIMYDKALNTNEIEAIFQQYPLKTVFVDDDYNNSTFGWQYDHFDRVQDGIDAVVENGDVYVYNGTYYENVIVDKTIDLIGEDMNTTIFDAKNNTAGFILNNDSISIKDVTIKNTSHYGIGIWLAEENNHTTISQSIISDCYYGIDITQSNHLTISNNQLRNNEYGIHSEYYENHTSFDTKIIENTIHHNSVGIGIISQSQNLTIQQNMVHNNTMGMAIGGMHNGTISQNTLIDIYPEYGLYLGNCTQSSIAHNIFNVNSSRGIEIFNSHHNIFMNNSIHDAYMGADFDDSSFNTFIQNMVTNNDYGINLHNSDYNIITENTASNNEIGINFYSSCNNTISHNNANMNNLYGIYLQTLSNHNIILNNTASQNEYGLTLSFSSDHNIILNNTALHNDLPGYALYSSNNNTIFNNLAESNNLYGIYMWSSSENEIYHNNLINNAQNAYDNGMNTWYNITLEEGNYWSDFDQPSEGAWDNNTDGIADTPYNIPSGSNQDQYPLMTPYGPPFGIITFITNQSTVYFNSSFSYDYDGIITSYQWDFGDGYQATVPNPVHTYYDDGDYLVTLTVSDDDGKNHTINMTMRAHFENLFTGWNLITIPVEKEWYASDMMENLTDCLMMSWFDAENQTFRTATSSGGYDFLINSGWGYFVYVLSDNTLSTCGPPISNVSVPLEIGWNMIGWYHDCNTTASSLMESVTGCIMVSWYDTMNETYRTATSSGGYDFTVYQGLGLFVYTTEASIWHGEG